MPRPDSLLDRMRRSQDNWHIRGLDRLFTGFGFQRIEGGRHTMFIHPEYPQLRATITRSDPPPKGYVRDAVRLVDKLLKMKSENA